MYDLAVPFGRYLLCGRRAFITKHRVDFSIQKFFVDLERLLTLAFEMKIRIQLFCAVRGFSRYWTNLQLAFVSRSQNIPVYLHKVRRHLNRVFFRFQMENRVASHELFCLSKRAIDDGCFPP